MQLLNRLVIVICLIASFYNCYSQTNDSISSNLTKELEEVYSQGYINGFSVAIVNQEGVLYTKGFGKADVETNKPYTTETIQTIASISKTFIGVALLKAHELGYLNLDEAVNKYLPFEVINPYFPNDTIIIRQLATHTSSIRDPSYYEKYGYVLRGNEINGAKANKNFRPHNELMSHSEFLENILSQEGKWYKKKNFIKEKPGAIFEYSNVGAGLAAIVLENATKTKFNTFTQNHILNPLGMSSSGWFSDEVDFSMHSKLYSNSDTELAPYQLVNYPDGGLMTSATHLGTYLVELISGYNGNGKILKKENYRELFSPQLTDKNYGERNESVYNDEYNMGIFMGISAQGQIGHTGGDPGVATHMFFNTKTNIGKILIVNTDLKKEGIKEFIDVWNTLEEYEVKF